MHRNSKRARRRPKLLSGTQSNLLLRPLGPSFWFRSLMKLIVQPPLYTGTCCVNGDRRFLVHRQLRARRGAWTSCVCAIESSVLAHNMYQRTECPPHQRNSAPDKPTISKSAKYDSGSDERSVLTPIAISPTIILLMVIASPSLTKDRSAPTIKRDTQAEAIAVLSRTPFHLSWSPFRRSTPPSKHIKLFHFPFVDSLTPGRLPVRSCAKHPGGQRSCLYMLRETS